MEYILFSILHRFFFFFFETKAIIQSFGHNIKLVHHNITTLVFGNNKSNRKWHK